MVVMGRTMTTPLYCLDSPRFPFYSFLANIFVFLPPPSLSHRSSVLFSLLLSLLSSEQKQHFEYKCALLRLLRRHYQYQHSILLSSFSFSLLFCCGVVFIVSALFSRTSSVSHLDR
jgi:hypothetical protein